MCDTKPDIKNLTTSKYPCENADINEPVPDTAEKQTSSKSSGKNVDTSEPTPDIVDKQKCPKTPGENVDTSEPIPDIVEKQFKLSKCPGVNVDTSKLSPDVVAKPGLGMRRKEAGGPSEVEHDEVTGKTVWLASPSSWARLEPCEDDWTADTTAADEGDDSEPNSPNAAGDCNESKGGERNSALSPDSCKDNKTPSTALRTGDCNGGEPNSADSRSTGIESHSALGSTDKVSFKAAHSHSDDGTNMMGTGSHSSSSSTVYQDFEQGAEEDNKEEDGREILPQSQLTTAGSAWRVSSNNATPERFCESTDDSVTLERCDGDPFIHGPTCQSSLSWTESHEEAVATCNHRKATQNTLDAAAENRVDRNVVSPAEAEERTKHVLNDNSCTKMTGQPKHTKQAVEHSEVENGQGAVVGNDMEEANEKTTASVALGELATTSHNDNSSREAENNNDEDFVKESTSLVFSSSSQLSGLMNESMPDQAESTSDQAESRDLSDQGEGSSDQLERRHLSTKAARKDLLKSDTPVANVFEGQHQSQADQRRDQSRVVIQGTDQNVVVIQATNQITVVTHGLDQSPVIIQITDQPQNVIQGTDQSSVIIQRTNQSPDQIQRTELAPVGIHRADQSSGLTHTTDQSPVIIQGIDQSPDLTQRTDQSPGLTQRTDQSPGLTQRTDQSPDLTQRTGQSPDLTQRTGQSPDLTQRTDQSSDAIQRTEQSHEAIQRTDQSPGMIQRTDQVEVAIQETDQPPGVITGTVNQVPSERCMSDAIHLRQPAGSTQVLEEFKRGLARQAVTSGAADVVDLRTRRRTGFQARLPRLILPGQNEGDWPSPSWSLDEEDINLTQQLLSQLWENCRGGSGTCACCTIHLANVVLLNCHHTICRDCVSYIPDLGCCPSAGCDTTVLCYIVID